MPLNEPFRLALLDGLFFIFHAAFVIFILVAWATPVLRVWHLAAVGATLFSWGVLGSWYGWGYCPCTDWHWQVRLELGREISSDSYLHFLIQSLTGLDFPEQIVDAAAVAGLAAALGLNLALRLRRRPAGN